MVRARATAIRSETGISRLTPLPGAPPVPSSWIHALQVEAQGRLGHDQIVPWGAVDARVSLLVRLVDVQDGPVRPDAGNRVDLLPRVGIAHRGEAAGPRHVRAAEPPDR